MPVILRGARIWYNMTYMKRFLSLFAVITVGTLFAEKQPLERYQPIIDRRPFGQPPPGYDPDSAVLDTASAAAGGEMTPEELSQEQAQLQRAVSFSMMNINNDGSVSVGFTDSTVPNAPKSYYMREHDTRDGWTVKSVDIYEQTAIFEKDGVEATLKLGASAKNEAKGGAHAAKGALSGRSPLLAGRFGNGGDGAMMSHATRRARREQAAAAAEKARAELEAERRRLAEDKAAKEAAEAAVREEERAATRQQLQAIQEELRRARDEARQRAEQDQEASNENNES